MTQTTKMLQMSPHMIKNGGYTVFSIRKDVLVRLELSGKLTFNVVLKIAMVFTSYPLKIASINRYVLEPARYLYKEYRMNLCNNNEFSLVLDLLCTSQLGQLESKQEENGNNRIQKQPCLPSRGQNDPIECLFMEVFL